MFVLHYYIVFFVWSRLVIQYKPKKEYGVLYVIKLTTEGLYELAIKIA